MGRSERGRFEDDASGGTPPGRGCGLHLRRSGAAGGHAIRLSVVRPGRPDSADGSLGHPGHEIPGLPRLRRGLARLARRVSPRRKLTVAVLTTSERLEEAQEALHQLLTGTQAVAVTDQNGERVEYRPANRAALERYVADLEAQLAGAHKPPHTIRFQTSKGL
ncbi:hypothetical protein EOW65_17305 [Sinirhodobacter ferrireducens]|uniref:Phage tail protein n=1 Tax=Paenirhodobacter ferrireducens TaxID=1215032 RepID=A0A443L783_9RHOB|nr:hypothetical protein EOW65_17305 [Sinirhodobacter ferrireducens]